MFAGRVRSGLRRHLGTWWIPCLKRDGNGSGLPRIGSRGSSYLCEPTRIEIKWLALFEPYSSRWETAILTENVVPMNKEMLTTDDISEYLHIGKRQIYRLIKEKIPATRITGKWLFPKQLIDEWIIASAKEMIRGKQKQISSETQAVNAERRSCAVKVRRKAGAEHAINEVEERIFIGSILDWGALNRLSWR